MRKNAFAGNRSIRSTRGPNYLILLSIKWLIVLLTLGDQRHIYGRYLHIYALEQKFTKLGAIWSLVDPRLRLVA